jgi:cysteine sulfinate desulfinase/cysteine desulfurase-like protein
MMPDARINGHPTDRLPNTLNISLPAIRGESMVLALDPKGVCLSSGSACKSGSPKPSHSLMAMGLSAEESHCALRFSLGADNTQEQIDLVLSLISEVLHESISTVQFVGCR